MPIFHGGALWYGHKAAQAGYLKAVSVGFLPNSIITRLPGDQFPPDWDGSSITSTATRAGKDAWAAQAEEMGIDLSQVMTIYTQQTQTELSAMAAAGARSLASWMK